MALQLAVGLMVVALAVVSSTAGRLTDHLMGAHITAVTVAGGTHSRATRLITTTATTATPTSISSRINSSRILVAGTLAAPPATTATALVAATASRTRTVPAPHCRHHQDTSARASDQHLHSGDQLTRPLHRPPPPPPPRHRHQMLTRSSRVSSSCSVQAVKAARALVKVMRAAPPIARGWIAQVHPPPPLQL